MPRNSEDSICRSECETRHRFAITTISAGSTRMTASALTAPGLGAMQSWSPISGSIVVLRRHRLQRYVHSS